MSGADGERRGTSIIQRIVEVFLRGNLSVMLIALSLLAGAVALIVTPREEEPQIVVPLADILVQAPGASAEEVERQISTRLEKLLYQIDGVEYVYSMSRPGSAIVTVRFYVGENREDSLVKIFTKINSHTDLVPPTVAGWVVKPVEIDDVPIVNITLFSGRYDDAQLRRLAEELEIKLQSVRNTNKTFLIGGRPRTLRVEVDPTLLAAHSLSMLEVSRALQASNARLAAGGFESRNREFLVDAGGWIEGAEALRRLVVGVHGGRTVRLGDVAEVLDAPSEPETYTRIGFPADSPEIPAELRERARAGEFFPAVNIAVAKKRGTNAVWVARAIEERLETLTRDLFPDGAYYLITRDYGATADHKVNELIEGLVIAVIIVIGLFALALGWREALVVAVAVPITFALTLLVNYLLGYTINRVTLFALTLALGLVVDDPIVDVENIYRHFKMRREPPLRATLTAVNEVRPPIILATLAVIISFVPMFFITGMMGPYMAPMALNVPLAMFMSLVVAFTITPWLSYHALKKEYGREERPWVLEESAIYKIYNRVLPVFLHSRVASWALLLFTAALFAWAGWLAMARKVPLKMLPFDNKNEFQIIVDMPEGTTLETTDAVACALADYLRTVPEVRNFQTYAGTASAMDFNGMVRHYYLRSGPNVADIRVNLVHKKERIHQSHDLALRLRRDLERIARERGANIKLVELPPGPPVISTVTAEVYGEPHHSYSEIQQAARVVRSRLEREALVVDVDDSIEDDQVKYVYHTDKEKAALAGISTEEIARTLRMALGGATVGLLHARGEVNPLPIEVRAPRRLRSSVEELSRIKVKGAAAPAAGGSAPPPLVSLGEIGHFEEVREDKTIYHKNLERVAYVFAEMAGRAPAEAILDIQADRAADETAAAARRAAFPRPRPAASRTYLSNGAGDPWILPPEYRVEWAGEGEWNITVRVFRDLGLAFAAACIGIYLLLVYQTASYFMPLILMISIPLTMIGIMPGFWILNLAATEPVGGFPNPVFFTATAMIGMIALSGIAVRNAILLIEFVHEALKRGQPLREALIQSGAVRFRPILLTAGSAMLAAWPITLDPIFSGLAWALIFGLAVSTTFTLLLIPVVYWMVYEKRPGHGLPPAAKLDE